MSAKTGKILCNEDTIESGRFPSNVLYGSKFMSSLEHSRGYTSAVTAFHQTQLSESIRKAHYSQTDSQAIQVLVKYKPYIVISSHLLPCDKEVFY